MSNEHSIKDGETLRKRIEAMPEDSVLFRSDFPEYHSEFVGETLAELTNEGILVKLAQGIYAKPRMSRFGAVLPSVEKIVQAIAVRDNAEVLPSGMTALNALGLSTQVPMSYTYLTTGSERTIKLTNRQVVLKRGVPKNFCYETRLIALLVPASPTISGSPSSRTPSPSNPPATRRSRSSARPRTATRNGRLTSRARSRS